MLDQLDRCLDDNRFLDCLEALADRIPALHSPRAHRPTAAVIVALSSVLATIAHNSPLDAAAAATTMISYAPTDRTIARWADHTARWSAGVLGRRLPRTAARVRRKNCVAFA